MEPLPVFSRHSPTLFLLFPSLCFSPVFPNPFPMVHCCLSRAKGCGELCKLPPGSPGGAQPLSGFWCMDIAFACTVARIGHLANTGNPVWYLSVKKWWYGLKQYEEAYRSIPSHLQHCMGDASGVAEEAAATLCPSCLLYTSDAADE